MPSRTNVLGNITVTESQCDFCGKFYDEDDLIAEGDAVICVMCHSINGPATTLCEFVPEVRTLSPEIFV